MSPPVPRAVEARPGGWAPGPIAGRGLLWHCCEETFTVFLPPFRPRLEALEDRLTPASHALDVAADNLRHLHLGQVAHSSTLEGAHASASEGLAEQGQQLINEGRYEAAVRVFTR